MTSAPHSDKEVKRAIAADAGVVRKHTSSILKLMETIRQKGPLTRRTLQGISGFSTPTIVQDVGRLIAAGLVYEAPALAGQRKRGPRAAELHARGDNKFVVCVEIRSNLMIGIVMDFDGSVLRRSRSVSRSKTKQQTESQLLSLVRGLLARVPAGAARVAICIAFPGYISGANKIVHSFHGREGWDNYPLAKAVEKRFGVETFLVNNSNAYIRAEKHFVYNSAEGNLLGIYLDNAMSMGIIVNGEVYEGQNFAAGEIGHLPYGDLSEQCHCGRRGCIEPLCTEVYLLEKMNARLGTEYPTIRELLGATDADSQEGHFVRRLIDEGLVVLSKGIATAVTLLNPAKVLIHGGIVPLAAHHLDIVRDYVSRYTFPASAGVAIELSTLDDTACAMGAGVLFIDRFYDIDREYVSEAVETPRRSVQRQPRVRKLG